MSITTRNLLGKGPSFPYNLTLSGGLAYTDDILRINQSLFILFETPKGSRLMMPEFGSDIHKYRFDPLDRVLMERLRYTITNDIARWEPRISLVSIEFLASSEDIDNSTLHISISYRIINTDVVHNYVYPYKRVTYDTMSISYK